MTGRSEPNFAYGYVAQAVEVEVDIETGHVRVVRVISTNDVGKAVNPELVKAQIEGCVVQAQGYAIMENLVSVATKSIRLDQIASSSLDQLLEGSISTLPCLRFRQVD